MQGTWQTLGLWGLDEMTEAVHMVSMPRWDWKAIEGLFDEFFGDEDPDDPRVVKRRRIVAAATELFLRQGYRKTSVEEIASAAGVAKGTVYLYFKNKTEVMIHAIAEEKRRHFVKLKPVFGDDLEPRERLRRYIATGMQLASEMPLVSRLTSGDREILNVLQDVPQEQAMEWERFRLDFLGEMVDQAAAPHRWTRSEIEDRVAVLTGLLHMSGLLADERLRMGLSIERFAEILADMIVDGVGPPIPPGGRK